MEWTRDSYPPLRPNPRLPPRLPSTSVSPSAGLRYVDSGGGAPAVVLLHAATGNLSGWAYQFTDLVGAGYRAIAYDRAGHGGSLRPDGSTSHHDVADLGLLLDDCGVDAAHLVGTAQGGRVVNQFAITHPSRVRSVTVASSAGGISAATFDDYGIDRSLPDAFDALPPEFRELGASYRAIDRPGVAEWIARLDEKATGVLPAIPQGIPVTKEALLGLSASALVLTGDADPFVPPVVSRVLASMYADSTLKIVPESGHSLFWERPDVFSARLIDFLGSN